MGALCRTWPKSVNITVAYSAMLTTQVLASSTGVELARNASSYLRVICTKRECIHAIVRLHFILSAAIAARLLTLVLCDN